MEAGGEFASQDEAWAIGHVAVRGMVNARDRTEDDDQDDGFAGDAAIRGGYGNSESGRLGGVFGDLGLSGHANEYFAWWFRGALQYSNAARRGRVFAALRGVRRSARRALGPEANHAAMTATGPYEAPFD